MKIAGVVLAGGQSQRMGKDKAKLLINEHTLLTHAVNLLKEAGFTDYYVSGQYPEFNCIIDQQPDLGPLAGISACASFLYEKYDAMFIIPVDMPLLAAKDCAYLVDLYKAKVTDNIPGLYYQTAIFPMLIVLNEPLMHYLSNVLALSHKKSRSLFRLFETLGIKEIKLKETHTYRFENTNTPAQWQDCLIAYEKLREQHKIQHLGNDYLNDHYLDNNDEED